MDRRIEILLDLIRTNGLSGQEKAIAEKIVGYLKAAGIGENCISLDNAHERIGEGECGNLMVCLPGTVAAPRILLSTHLDTVQICQDVEPVLDGETIKAAGETGLGGDDRAGCAILLSTLLEIVENDLPHPPLTFLWTVQEESGVKGSRNLDVSKLQEPMMGFNFDGREGLEIGATGKYHLEIEIAGKASHAGSSPEKGVSAVAIAGLAIAELQQQGWLGKIDRDGKAGTANIGRIESAYSTNIVAPENKIIAEVRSHDPAFRQEILQAFADAFANAATQVKNVGGEAGQVEIKNNLLYESFCLAEDEMVVKTAVEIAGRIGIPTELKLSNGGLDANWLNRHGIPTVNLGTGTSNNHTVNESINIPKFFQTVDFALQAATTILP